MKYSFGLMFLLLSSSALAENRITLTLGSMHSPMHTEQLTGFVDLVLKKAYERFGYQLDIVRIKNEGSLTSANKGIFDGLSIRIAGMQKKYPNLVRVPEKIVDWQFVGFSKQRIDISKGWNSLTPYTTAIVTGWKIFEYNIPEKKSISKVSNPELLFNLLDKNRSDIILYERWQGLELIRLMGYKNIKVLSPAFAEKEMFTYLHVKHKSLVPKLNKALKEMKKDGTYQALYDSILSPLVN